MDGIMKFLGRIQGIPMNNEKYCPIVAVDGKQVFLGVRMVYYAIPMKKLAII